jgi:cation transporter-like permease
MWKRKRQRDGIAGSNNNNDNDENDENAVPSLNELMLENERLRKELEEYKARAASSSSKSINGNNNSMQPLQISPDNTDGSDENGSSTGYVAFGGESRDGLMIHHDDDVEKGGERSTDGSPLTIKEDFFKTLADRGSWLVGLLVLQSMSSFIIAHNEELLQQHAVIIQFLTMLVGAGGNAGNQASVRVIRGLAIGSITSSNTKPFLKTELLMGLCLSVILALAGFVRAFLFWVPWPETFAITSSLFLIVALSVVIGALLPLAMKFVGIDPAHSRYVPTWTHTHV